MENQVGTGMVLGRSSDLANNSDQMRTMQEVQASIAIAKRFPRNEIEAQAAINRSCQRLSLAERAVYTYKRGGSQVTGPSIRLAEVLAQNWGNLCSGIRELEQRDGESVVEAFCWDMQNNVRQSKIFVVKHERKAKGNIVKMDDPRDIYEHVANMGARRLRACILATIPADVTEGALEVCEETMKNPKNGPPLKDRLIKMVTAFEGISVTKEMLEQRIGHKLEVTNGAELAGLQKIFVSIRDGFSKREEWFELPSVASSTPSQSDEELTKKILSQAENQSNNSKK